MTKEELITIIFEGMPDNKLALFLDTEIETIEEADGETLLEKIEGKAEGMSTDEIKAFIEKSKCFRLLETTRGDKKVS